MEETQEQLKRIETIDLYALKDDAKGIIRIRPAKDRDKKDWGRTWAALSNYLYLPNITCPTGIFLDICVHGGKNCLMLEVNTQRTKQKKEVHKYLFYPFEEFEKAVNEMEKQYLSLIKESGFIGRKIQMR